MHKQFRQLDALGKHGPAQYFVFSWDQILSVVHWELFHNNLFTLGSQVIKQCQGVPIGGPLSAQLASIYCLACETHKQSVCPLKGIFGPMARFRDNIFICCLQDLSPKEIVPLFQTMYQLQLTIEQSGKLLQSLEMFAICSFTMGSLFTHFPSDGKQL